MMSALAVCSCATGQGPLKRQMFGLIEKFDRWDHNGDGHLSLGEVGEAEKLREFTSAEIIEFYDNGGDGKISLREAQNGMTRLDVAKKTAADRNPAQ